MKKEAEKIAYILYLGKQIFSLRSFPEFGQKEKDGKERREKLVITMASNALPTPPRVAHVKPPGPTILKIANPNSK